MSEEFVPFPKIARLNRDMIITEKIDGTNAQVWVSDDIENPIVRAASRTRWITPQDDNQGFARWVEERATELAKLGPGRHFGEWWGSGIQRTYGLTQGVRRFSLFNVSRWTDALVRPACCDVVPTLYAGPFNTAEVQNQVEALRMTGSRAQPGYMNPEGVVVYHVQGNHLFKVTLEKDNEWKGRKA